MKTMLAFLIGILVWSCSKKENAALPNAEQYITWEVAGKKGALVHPTDSVAAARFSPLTHLAAADNASSQVYLIFNSPEAPGIYAASYQEFSVNQTSYLPTSNPVMVNINQYGAIGAFITGTYAGTVKDSLNQPHTISGFFRIRRR